MYSPADFIMGFVMGTLVVLMGKTFIWAVKAMCMAFSVMYVSYRENTTGQRVDKEESDRIFRDLLERIDKKPSSSLPGHQEPKEKDKAPPPPPEDDPPYSSMYPERAKIFLPRLPALPPPARTPINLPPVDKYHKYPSTDDIIRLPSHLPKIKSARLAWWFDLVSSYPEIDAYTPQGRHQLYEIVKAQEQEIKSCRASTKRSIHIPSVETTDGLVPQARQSIQPADITSEPKPTAPSTTPLAQLSRTAGVNEDDSNPDEPTKVIEVCESCGASRDHWATHRARARRNAKITLNKPAEQIEGWDSPKDMRLSASV